MRGRRGKYDNKITELNGIRFHSKKEARRYQHLQLMQYAGLVQNITIQPRFALTAHGIKICTYVADFLYTENGKEVIEDAKGVETAVFKLKWKILKAQEGEKYIYRIT